MLTNHTPLPAIARPYRDHKGHSHILVVVKGGWRLSTGRMAAAEQQVGLHEQSVKVLLGDLLLDEAQRKALATRRDEEIVWLDHDLSPPKPAFDVLVAGYITAPPNYTKDYIDASIRIGQHSSGMRAFAPRYWRIGWFSQHAKTIVPAVRRVPITYAVADWSEGFPLNPPGASQGLVAAWLPWIETKHASSRRLKYSKKPAGMGFWPENVWHRQPHAGTYDEVWQRERSPDLPKDFNTRFYNVAHPDLQLPAAPVAGTAIQLKHLSTQANIECCFPSLQLSVQATTAAGNTLPVTRLQADTLIIEPEYDRLSVVWRILLPAGAQQTALRSVRLFKT
ncbi:hypothetical protein AAKU61_004471 [Undibacterium sp. GrIS 1.2]|uniref:DUF2169 family type VI secretion system accessory protein n=1 Tax=Undibacterium sp. GrIS 1.2 TaxID=3143933 RepID=UPI003397F7CC